MIVIMSGRVLTYGETTPGKLPHGILTTRPNHSWPRDLYKVHIPVHCQTLEMIHFVYELFPIKTFRVLKHAPGQLLVIIPPEGGSHIGIDMVHIHVPAFANWGAFPQGFFTNIGIAGGGVHCR